MARPKRTGRKAKRKSVAVESSPPAEDLVDADSEPIPSVQSEGKRGSTDEVLGAALTDPEQNGGSGDDEGPDDVLLVKGRDEALEHIRSVDEAVKRCGHTPHMKRGIRLLL